MSNKETMKEHQNFSYNDLLEQHNALLKDARYRTNVELLQNIIKMHPKNDDLYWIAIKVSIVDTMLSTHLSQYSSILSLHDISKIILDLHVDNSIEQGDSTIVEEIAKQCKNFNGAGMGINLFSFASKYCSNHNIHVYGKDDFSIYDSTMERHLYLYATERNPLNEKDPWRWKKEINYSRFNEYIGDLLDERGIIESTCPNRRLMFDQFVWNSNRKSK